MLSRQTTKKIEALNTNAWKTQGKKKIIKGAPRCEDTQMVFHFFFYSPAPQFFFSASQEYSTYKLWMNVSYVLAYQPHSQYSQMLAMCHYGCMISITMGLFRKLWVF